jgi:hypothetical protein
MMPTVRKNGLSVRQLVELLQSLVSDQAVGVDRVRAVEGLKHGHRFGVAANLAISQPVHRSARMLPRASGQQVPVPGVRHLDDGIVVPVRSAAAAGMMRDLADGNRRVTSFAEPRGKARRDRFRILLHSLTPSEQRSVAIRAVHARQQGVPRRATRRSLHVVPLERSPACRQRVDVWRVNVVLPKTPQLGPQVIDAQQQYVWLFGSGQRTRHDEQKYEEAELDGGAKRHDEPAELRCGSESHCRVAQRDVSLAQWSSRGLSRGEGLLWSLGTSAGQ